MTKSQHLTVLGTFSAEFSGVPSLGLMVYDLDGQTTVSDPILGYSGPRYWEHCRVTLSIYGPEVSDLFDPVPKRAKQSKDGVVLADFGLIAPSGGPLRANCFGIFRKPV